MKRSGLIFIFLLLAFFSKSQPPGCTLKPAQVTIHFGSGNPVDQNTGDLSGYRRVYTSCPPDGYYSFVSSTAECFHDDWHTIPEDHTAGDAAGNMMLVNAAPRAGIFLRMPIAGLKKNTTYEVGMWIMNLCKPTDKCPYPLLPRLNVRLETTAGLTVANFVTGDVARIETPWWRQYRAFFTSPQATSTLMLVMSDNNPGGCGNDFALDDITFRECVKEIPKPVVIATKTPEKKAVTTKKPTPATTVRKILNPPQNENLIKIGTKQKADTIATIVPVGRPNLKVMPSAPLVLRTRQNPLVKKIETEASEIKIDIYDNGEIDGDTVSIYHNNTLIRSHMRLSQNPISLTIAVDPSKPHHELIMVAENLGSIPPNTSVMSITTPSKFYRVFISSSEQKNAMVVFDLKK